MNKAQIWKSLEKFESFNVCEFSLGSNIYRCDFVPQLGCFQVADIELPNIPVIISIDAMCDTLLIAGNTNLGGIIKKVKTAWNNMDRETKMRFLDEIPLNSFMVLES